MIDLLDILVETLVEANPEKDLQQNALADKYINRVKELINGYTKDTSDIKYEKLSNGVQRIEISLKGLDISINDGRSPIENLAQMNMNYNPPRLIVYGADIEKNEKLTVKFDENIVKHELTHFLDYKRTGYSPEKAMSRLRKSVEKHGYSGYYNNPLESNAHFYELFVPEITKYLSNKKELPKSYQDFKNGLLKNIEAKNFYDQLNDKNQRKLEKRLIGYYNGVLKNPNFKIQEPEQDINKKRLIDISKKFWDRIRSKFKPAA